MTAKIVPERSGLTAAQTRDVYYAYDLRGLQTQARFDSPSGEGVATSYDGFGRSTSSTLAMAGTSRAIGHAYDASGNRNRIVHPDGYFTYECDGLNRLLRVRENGGDPLVAFAYNPASQRSGLTSGGTTSAYAYDSAGRLQSLNHNLAGTSADQVIGLGYNPASQIASRTGTNDAYAWPGSVAVDRPYSVNGQNQYTAAGSSTFTYDANGNLTSDGSSTFVYDVENRLVSASGAKTAALVYDPLGRLFETSGGAAGITRFLYADDALIAEYNAAGTMLHRYIHGADKGVDDPLIWYDNAASGWRRALIADQQGSIIAVADMYGAPLAINAYDEYGIPKTGNAGRFQYTGQAWIPELGMYHYKARIYSPTLGRFLQTDPIGYYDQVNFYAYVRNDPVNGTDPTGLDTVVSLVAYPLPGAAGWFGYGHSYVRYRDTETGAVRIARAGPSVPYDGGSSGAVNGNPSPNGATVQAIDTPLGESIDRPSNNPGTQVLQSVTIKVLFDKVRDNVGTLNEEINNAKTPYDPQENNSNRYAGDVFEALTGVDVKEDTSITLPGLDSGDLLRRKEPR